MSDGDPALAFGPAKGPALPGTACPAGTTNGSRLYYANLSSKLNAQRGEQQQFRGFEAIYVSRTDCPDAAGASVTNAWAPPVLATPRSTATTFADKENLYVDNSPSSKFNGNVYVCFTAFRSNGHFMGNSSNPEPIEFVSSKDGGNEWVDQKQLSPATDTFANGGRQGCAIRTDSQGTIYVFWAGVDTQTHQSVFYKTRSFDGGAHFERPSIVTYIVPVGHLDPNTGRFSIDGLGGARTDSFPSVDIANGAGTSATVGHQNDPIVITWSDGRSAVGANSPDGPIGPGEKALVIFSTDQGNTWSPPVDATSPADVAASHRPAMPAVAIGPSGKDLWVTYDSFYLPWQTTTVLPRNMEGVVTHASFATLAACAGQPPASTPCFTETHRGVVGDARGSSQNNLAAEFLGDYNYAAATDANVVAVWNDVRAATDCPAVDAYRQLFATSPPDRPFVAACGTFGNSDIFGGSYTP